MRRHKRKVKKQKKKGGGQVHVKAHTRTPRGPNQGKKIVRVPSYSRKKARKGH